MSIEVENIQNELVKTISVDIPFKVKKDNCNIAEFVRDAIIEPLTSVDFDVNKGKYRIRILAVITEDDI